MEETEAVSIWNKTGQDLTVAESLKIVAGVTIVSMALPFVVLAAVGAVGKLAEKVRIRKHAKAFQDQMA